MLCVRASSVSFRWQPTSRAWRWQKCYQMAYLQTAPAVNSIRSQVRHRGMLRETARFIHSHCTLLPCMNLIDFTQKVNLTYCVNQCHAIFGDAVNPKLGSAKVLEKFGGATPTGSNIFFSNGGDDPWQQAAVKVTQSTCTWCSFFFFFCVCKCLRLLTRGAVCTCAAPPQQQPSQRTLRTVRTAAIVATCLPQSLRTHPS